MRTVALAEVADVNPRMTSRPADDETVAFVPMAQLQAEQASTSAGQSRPFGEVSKGYTMFMNGDLLMAKITPCFENNKIGQARLSHPVGVGSTEFHVVRPKPGLVDDRYLLHFLRQDRIRIEGERRMTGSGGQRRVPPAFVKGLQVPLPALEEQRRIATILDQADAIHAKSRLVVANVKDLIQSIFFEKFGDPIMNPRALPIRTLGEWVDPLAPITYGILKPGPHLPEGVPYVRVVDIQDGQVALVSVRRTSAEIAQAYKRSRLSSGDLVISIRGHVGRLGVIPDELDGANITQDSARLRLPTEARDYIAAALGTDALGQWLARRTKGAAVRGINLGDLRLAPIPVPPTHELLEFKQLLGGVRDLTSGARAQADAAQAIFDSVQASAYTVML